MSKTLVHCRVRMWPFGETDWGVLADVEGGLAIHMRYGMQDGYTVTDVESGIAVAHCPTLKAARAERERMMAEDRLAEIRKRAEGFWPESMMRSDARWMLGQLTAAMNITRYFATHCSCTCGDHDAMVELARRLVEEVEGE